MFHAQQKAYGNRVRRMTPNWFDVWTRMIRVRSITPELHQAAMTALSDKGFEDAVAVQPPGRVEIQVESSDAGAASVSTATLTFTQSNWSTAQRVTVTGVDDNVEQSGNRHATISHRTPSTDPKPIFPSPLSQWWMMMALCCLPCQQWSSALSPTVAARPPAVARSMWP